MSRRLSGAALNASLVRQARTMLVESYGLPMDEYDAEVHRVPLEYAGQDTLSGIVFTRRSTGAEVRIEGPVVADDGELLQFCLNLN